MVEVIYRDAFKDKIKKIKDNHLKSKIVKQTLKIADFPEIGKPMRFTRKETREVYVKPYRLVYAYFREEAIVVFLDLYHKDKQ